MTPDKTESISQYLEAFQGTLTADEKRVYDLTKSIQWKAEDQAERIAILETLQGLVQDRNHRAQEAVYRAALAELRSAVQKLKEPKPRPEFVPVEEPTTPVNVPAPKGK